MKSILLSIILFLVLSSQAQAGEITVAAGEIGRNAQGDWQLAPVFNLDRKLVIGSFHSLIVYEVKPNPKRSRWVVDEALWSLTPQSHQNRRIGRITLGKTPDGFVARGVTHLKPDTLYGVGVRASGYFAEHFFGYHMGPSGPRLATFAAEADGKKAFGFKE